MWAMRCEIAMGHGSSDNEALRHYTQSTTIDLKGLCSGHRFAFIS
jgi:hypothetical protein